VLGVSEQVDSNVNDRFTSETIKFVLVLLAFITPYVLSIGIGPEIIDIRSYAPLWRFGSMSYPIFWIWPLDNLITELPFGLVRLAFIRQVLLYKKRLTTPTRLVLIGVLCELPGPILYSVFLGGPLYFPFPLFPLIGLLLARYSSKETLSWIEVEES